LIETWNDTHFEANTLLLWGGWVLLQGQNSDVHFPYGLYTRTGLMLMEKNLQLEDGDDLKEGPLVRV
jgi:hypothetical protein